LAWADKTGKDYGKVKTEQDTRKGTLICQGTFGAWSKAGKEVSGFTYLGFETVESTLGLQTTVSGMMDEELIWGI
jgi:hypothetical protein